MKSTAAMLEGYRSAWLRTHREISSEDLDEVPERCLVVGVDEDKIFRKQEPNNVILIFVEHRDAAETSLEDI